MPRDILRVRFDQIIEDLTNTQAPPWYHPIRLYRWRQEHDRLLVQWLADAGNLRRPEYGYAHKVRTTTKVLDP